MNNKITAVFLVTCFFLLTGNLHAAKQTIVKMKPRSEGFFRTVIIDPGEHFAAAVLIQGGKGKLNIRDDGIRGGKKNYLIHFRDEFVKAGLLVAIADAPRDYYGKQGMKKDQFRVSKGHAKDIAAVIRKLRKKTNKPIWLIGTSRGTISAANAAARLSGNNAPDGIVLTASVTTLTSKGWATIHDVNLSKISVPVLVTHHVADACPSTPYSGTEKLLQSFPKAKIIDFLWYEGGDAGEPDNRCNRLSAHGYMGQELKTIEDMIGWLKKHSQ